MDTKRVLTLEEDDPRVAPPMTDQATNVQREERER